MKRFVVVTEDGEVYGPWESTFEAQNWANTYVVVDFTIAPIPRAQVPGTDKG